MANFPQIRILSILGCTLLLLTGCGKKSNKTKPANETNGTQATAQQSSPQGQTFEPLKVGGSSTGTSVGTPGTNGGQPVFQPLNVGGNNNGVANNSTGNSSTTGSTNSTTSGNTRSQMELVKSALHPLQVYLGSWRGVNQKAKSLSNSEWIWDFQSNRDQPALVMTSADSPYIRKGRLTFLSDKNVYQMTITDDENTTKVFQGSWQEPVRDTPDENNRMQRTFKLKLTETSPEAGAEEIVFNQKETNRYLLELYKKRGSGSYLRYDTVGTQREGTSFALTEEKYGEKECIVSQGLGTSTVSYMGKTYYVCCSGCRAAFDENPEFWIAKADERAKEKEAMKKQ